MKKEMDPKLKKCIEDCSKCYQSCISTMSHCIKMGREHAGPEHLKLLKDCAEICKLSESFMLRESDHSKHVCTECAEICEECSASCEKVDPEDEVMKECAKICKACAKSCREM